VNEYKQRVGDENEENAGENFKHFQNLHKILYHSDMIDRDETERKLL